MIARDAFLLLSGFGLLRLVSVRKEGWPFGVLGGFGLSWLAGVALLGAVTTLVGSLGLSTDAWPFVVPLMSIPAIAGGLSAVRGPRDVVTRVRVSWRGSLWGALLTAAVAAPSALIVWVGSVNLTTSNDEYAIWALKARALALFGRIDPHVFAGAAAYSRAHLDYPLAVPAYISWVDPAAAGVAHAHLALMAVAMLAVIAWGVRRLAGVPAAFLAVALVAANPRLGPQSVRLFGDVPLASFAVAATLLLAVWIRSDDRRSLAAAGVMLAGMLLTKNEGLLFFAAVVCGALVACGRGRRKQALAAAGLAVVPFLPWLAYLRINGLSDDTFDFAGLIPTIFIRRLNKLPGIVSDMSGQWPSGLVPFVLAGIALVVALRNPDRRRAAIQLGVTASLAWLGLALVYTLSTLDVHQHIASSALRVTLFPALLTLIAIPTLLPLPDPNDR